MCSLNIPFYSAHLGICIYMHLYENQKSNAFICICICKCTMFFNDKNYLKHFFEWCSYIFYLSQMVILIHFSYIMLHEAYFHIMTSRTYVSAHSSHISNILTMKVHVLREKKMFIEWCGIHNQSLFIESPTLYFYISSSFNSKSSFEQ